MKKAWIAFVVTLVVILPARVYCMTALLDPATGFYRDGGKLVLIVSIVLAAGALASVLLVVPGKQIHTAWDGRPVRNVPAAVAGVLAGLFVVLQSLVGFSGGFGDDSQVLYYIVCVLGIPAGAVILATGYGFATGKNVLGHHPLAALLPSVWGCAMLILLFITYAAMVNLVENAYTTFTVIFLLLFLFAQAKLLTGVESEKSTFQLYAVGFPAALIALAASIPECVMDFSGHTVIRTLSAGQQIVCVVMAIYILSCLAAQQKSLRPVSTLLHSEPAPMSEEDAERPEIRQASPVLIPSPQRAGVLSPEAGADWLAECAQYLNEACGSSEKFAESVQSPFLSTL